MTNDITSNNATSLAVVEKRCPKTTGSYYAVHYLMDDTFDTNTGKTNMLVQSVFDDGSLLL